jgi:hypothetical protein
MSSDFHASVYRADQAPDVLATGEFHCFDCGQTMRLEPNQPAPVVRRKCWCGIEYELLPEQP